MSEKGRPSVPSWTQKIRTEVGISCKENTRKIRNGEECRYIIPTLMSMLMHTLDSLLINEVWPSFSAIL